MCVVVLGGVPCLVSRKTGEGGPATPVGSSWVAGRDLCEGRGPERASRPDKGHDTRKREVISSTLTDS